MFGQAPSSADALYERREQPAAARQAADLYQAQRRDDPRDFVAAWKHARALYFLGTHGPEAERRDRLEGAMEASRAAIALNDARPEGHFWLAAGMGALAESFGLRQGLKYRSQIKAALERVLAIDPAFQQGSADRALGRWYFKVPGLFGGSTDKAITHLRKSMAYNPDSTASLFFLAEVHLEKGERAEARKLLQQVIDAPFDPEWTPEDRAFKADARRLLAGAR